MDRTLSIVCEADLPALVIDPRSGRILRTNDRFEEIFDQPSDLPGAHYRELVEEARHREIREFLSILSFGGSRPPLRLRMRIGDGEHRPSTWVGIPTVMGEPLDPIVVVTRPTGGPVGKPLGPPSSLVDRSDDGLDRIPPRRGIQDRRGDAEKSRSLWASKW